MTKRATSNITREMAKYISQRFPISSIRQLTAQITFKSSLTYLNHTQPVERNIQDLAKVSQNYVKEDRDSVLRVVMNSREKMPKYSSKKQFQWYLGNKILIHFDLDAIFNIIKFSIRFNI